MSYQFNTLVNKNEAEALKELIFRRVRERSENMNEAVQADVMDMARDSFVSKGNPFAQIIENNQVNISENKTEETSKQEEDKEIGFPVKEIKEKLNSQNRVLNQQMESSAIVNNMNEARAALSSKTSFMGALNFLNSQAAVSLMRSRADKFEVVV